MKGNRVRAVLSMIVTMSLSSVGALFLVYLAWRMARRPPQKRLANAPDSDSDEGKRENRMPRSDSENTVGASSFDTNIIWTVVRPVLTQVIASSLQDRVTQNAFRQLCLSVLADEKMKSKFREVVTDVWRSNDVQESIGGCVVALASSETIAHSLALLLRNACVDDQTALGLSKVLAKTLSMMTEENKEAGQRVLQKSLPASPPGPKEKRSGTVD